MKTRNYFALSAVLFLALGLSITGCKKDTKDTTDPTSMTQLSKDENAVQSADDQSMNDVDAILSKSKNKSIEGIPCNITIDSATITKDNDSIIYTITYNGANCVNTMSRSGQVQIKRKVDEFWGQANARVMVKYINLTITKNSTGKSIVLNGSKTYQNVSGHRLIEIGTGEVTSITHRATGSLIATFDDNSTRTWNVARQRVFTGTASALICTVSGFGTDGAYSNLVVWGTNRNGEAFYTQINTPIVYKQSCNWEPSAGVKVHQIPSDNKSLTATFGYNDLNQTTTDCASKYKVDWVRNGKTGTAYFAM